MKAEELRKAIADIVKEYISNEEMYSDDVQLEINTENLSVAIADPEQDLPNCDYYPIMDLVNADPAHPGKWTADKDAIEEVIADYIVSD